MVMFGTLAEVAIVIVDCPHCYTRVVPTSQDTCPSCRQSVIEASETDPSKVSISVAHLQPLPDVCCTCGCGTDRIVKITRKISRKSDVEPSDDLLTYIGSLFSWMSLLFALIRGDFRSRVEDQVVVRMPQCEICFESGMPEPVYVNAHELRMTFIVNQEFKSRVEQDGVS